MLESRGRKVGIPKFLQYLYQILEREDEHILSWSDKGESFHIHDVQAMTKFILPKYFKHSKYASFQRQLNYFGFRKWTKTQTDKCTFSHEHFRRGYEAGLRLIKRKNYPQNPGSRRLSRKERNLQIRLQQNRSFPSSTTQGVTPTCNSLPSTSIPSMYSTSSHAVHRMLHHDDFPAESRRCSQQSIPSIDPSSDFHHLEMNMTNNETSHGFHDQQMMGSDHYQEYWSGNHLDNFESQMSLEYHNPTQSIYMKMEQPSNSHSYIDWESHIPLYGHMAPVSSF